MATKKTKQCPTCKGKGRVNCVMGSLVCGKCNGVGKLDPSKPHDFVSSILRSLGKPEEEIKAAAEKAAKTRAAKGKSVAKTKPAVVVGLGIKAAEKAAKEDAAKGKYGKDAPSLHSGYDTFTPDPGKWKSKKCMTCGDKMDVERNCNGPTSWAMAMGGSKRAYDRFICPNAGKDWHNQVIHLMKEKDRTASVGVEKTIQKEIDKIKKTRKATKKVNGLF